MAKILLKHSGGGTYSLETVDSLVLGPALKNRDGIPVGSVFKPATGADRDDLVAALQAMNYAARAYNVILSYTVPGEGEYTVNATRSDTQDELEAWIENEREAMAKRLDLKDPFDIAVTITEV